MLENLRAWDLAQEDLLILDPEDNIFSAVEKLLARQQPGRHTCAVVQDKNERFLGTLSTHRVLRAVGKEIHEVGAFRHSPEVNMDDAVHAACRVVGGHSVRDHMYTKPLEVAPQTTIGDLLKLFSTSMNHFAVVTEAGRALGLLDLEDIFKTFAKDMLSDNPTEV